MCDLMRRKMRYAGNLLRGSAGNLGSTLLKGTIEGTRARGRQRTKWADDIKKWSSTASYGEAKRAAENRVRWRTMVANLRVEDGT